MTTIILTTWTGLLKVTNNVSIQGGVGVRGGWHIGYDGYGILGTSGYDYNHPDDMDSVVKGHKQCKYTGWGGGTGRVAYRV